ncbi:unnamed protein product [Soboliphyme baturini]|uniref:ER membrane protein complex subunit 10 n=1 Tax=Soboliphyme baturini TaxID=241478 RepID=A0A183IDL0_9BILA|nr:unnamed protein product [Soboliphyme baturini]
MSITIHPSSFLGDAVSTCSNLNIGMTASEFNTTVHVTEIGYLQKLEKAKLEKERGEHGDNRSFFSKYWMYILPFVVFMLITSAMNPETRQAGR